ncbi:putative beta-mannosidase [Aureobasidium subglaciale]|nr:putative beta-mannosidase [Aureobasidium subglaciale]
MTQPATKQALVTREIKESWEFKQTDLDDWMPVKTVPTNVHLDLIANNVIPDPFLGFNELKCEWVADKSWTYRTTLPDVGAAKDGQVHELVFDGLDTFATVKVNGDVVLESDNMFIPHRVNVTEALKNADSNVLEIDFRSALVEGRKIKDAHPEHKWVGFNADMARLATRKAQYHWGWDWGPVLMTCGPWRAVRLETSYARISDLRVDYDLNKSLDDVIVRVSVNTERSHGADARISILDGSDVIFEKTVAIDSKGLAKADFHIAHPKLWYPHGYGEQPLYTCQAVLVIKGQDIQTCGRKTGFRRGELVQEPDEVGKTFFFRINGVDVFCGGSCWIPADSFTPRVTKAKYQSWLQTLVDGYQVMVRIWGGGIWEEDIFYDTCDELGILVWQDFMFGCGNYPAAIKEFRESVEAECVAQVKRIRHHPSIVIYAGNNEDYQVQEQCGLTYDYADKDPENWLRTDFPARYLYEKTLPEVIAAHSPHVPYHPGSPWGDGLISSDQTVGDMHQWNVWHGTQEKYQIFDTLGGRFNSEFGMEAFPHIDTIKYYVTDPAELYPQSHMIDFHNKADGHERRIATYLIENFRTTDTSLEAYIHLTQLSQSDALMYGYRGWRQQWGKKRLCGGALVWQLNDCWPVTSWAIIDYFQRKKPAYYAMRRVLAPIAVAVKRAHHDWSVVHARPAKTSPFECWVSSNSTKEVTATKVELKFISIATGKEIKEALVKKNVKITANGTTNVFDGELNNEKEEPHVLAARIWIEGESDVISRDVDWPQPLKYLNMDERGVKVTFDDGKITVTSAKPTKGLVFEEREGVLVNDSAVDIVPGDQQTITVKGLKPGDAPLKWRYYGQILQAEKDSLRWCYTLRPIKRMLVSTRSHLFGSCHPRIEDLAASVERYRLVFQRLFPGRDIEQLALLSKDDLVAALDAPPPATDLSTRTLELGSPTSTLESEGADSLETLIQAPEQDPVADEATRHQARVQGISDDVNGLSLSLDRPSSYVGVSSITAALKVICRVAPATRRLLALGQPETALPSRTGSPSLDLENLDPMYTPPADVGHVLIETYFNKVHPLMPMLDEQQFWQIWLYGERRDSAWLALLNTVLALGSVMSSECTSNAHEAYYQRAMQLLDLDSLGSGNTLVVQALGLLSGYYRPNLANNLMGATLRQATVLDAQDPETAKFLPLVYNVQFCRIATQIQDALCATPILPFDELNRLDRELLQWHTDLPASLKLDASTNGNSQQSSKTHPDAAGILRTTSMIMHWRYQNLRLLLHRPYLLATALRSGSDATLSAEEKVGVGRCRAVAARTISDISSMCPEDLLAGWNGVWFMYQAVMVPLVCAFSSLGKSQSRPMDETQSETDGREKASDKARTRDQTGLQEWQAQIEQALQYFERMTHWSTTAKKSRDVVSRLYEASKHLADQDFRSRFSAQDQFLRATNQPQNLDSVATNQEVNENTLDHTQTSMPTSNLLTEDIWGLSPNGAAAMNNFWFDDMMWDIPAVDTDMFDNTGTGFAYNELDWLSSLNYHNGGDQGWQYQPQ